MPPRFANRLNARHRTSDGRWIYESRSVAVTAVVVAFDASSSSFHALASQRGPAVDMPGTWCLVCGYLDWDERLDDAIRREVFEEAGLDLAQLEAAGQAVVPSQPIWVQSDPASNRQNVTARFSVELSTLAPATTANAEPDEVLAVKWMPLVASEIDALTWAFNHERILHELTTFLDGERAAGQLDAGSIRRYYRQHMERQYPFR